MSRYENPNAINDAAKEASEIFERFPFKLSVLEHLDQRPEDDNQTPQIKLADLKKRLSDLKIQLENGTIDGKTYFEDKYIQAAFKNITDSQSHYFFLNTLRLWYQQPHTFSVYEKIFMWMSMIALTLGAILLPENLILFFNARPALQKTGYNIDDYCSPAVPGLQPTVSDICASLSNGMKAVFSMAENPSTLPTRIVPTNSSADVSTQHIPSWFNPLSWFNYATCELKDNVFKMVGHSISGSPTSVQAKAGNGVFPVVTMTENIIPLLANATIQATVGLFFLQFCVVMEKGGRGEFGHTNGFERPAEDFGLYARIFGSVYGFVVGAAALTAIVLQSKKAVSKWDDSRDERRIHALFQKFVKPIIEDAARSNLAVNV